jgi:hypothetical protein
MVFGSCEMSGLLHELDEQLSSAKALMLASTKPGKFTGRTSGVVIDCLGSIFSEQVRSSSALYGMASFQSGSIAIG